MSDNPWTKALRSTADEIGVGREDREVVLDGRQANWIAAALQSSAQEIDDLRAARRFLALTETGPDYEAAKALYEQEFPCHCDAAYLDRGRHDPNCEWPYAEDVSRRIVDAALADYLTEKEERNGFRT